MLQQQKLTHMIVLFSLIGKLEENSSGNFMSIETLSAWEKYLIIDKHSLAHDHRVNFPMRV